MPAPISPEDALKFVVSLYERMTGSSLVRGLCGLRSQRVAAGNASDFFLFFR